MPTHISLPNERVEQLRMIAAAKNQTIPQVIADFVRAEIAKGTIPDALPGIDVEVAGPRIVIKSGDFEASVPTDEGLTFADLLKQSGGLMGFDEDRRRRWIEGLAVLSGAKLKRAGNGLKIVSPITGRELPLNLDIAADLGDQIAKVTQ